MGNSFEDLSSNSLNFFDISILMDKEFYLRLTVYIALYAIFCLIWHKICEKLSEFFKNRNKKPSKLYYYCLVYSNPVLEFVIPVVLIVIFSAIVTIQHKNQNGSYSQANLKALCNLRMKTIKQAVEKYNKNTIFPMQELNLTTLKEKRLILTTICPETMKETYVSVGDLSKDGTIKCSLHGKLNDEK